MNPIVLSVDPFRGGLRYIREGVDSSTSIAAREHSEAPPERVPEGDPSHHYMSIVFQDQGCCSGAHLLVCSQSPIDQLIKNLDVFRCARSYSKFIPRKSSIKIYISGESRFIGDEQDLSFSMKDDCRADVQDL